MRPPLPPALRSAFGEVVSLSPGQALLRLTVVVAPLLVLVAARGAGATWSGPVTVVVLVLALGAALEPDSHIGLVVLAVLGWFWLARVPDPTNLWALVAGWAVLAFHAAAALTATAPAGATRSGTVLGRWLWRVLAAGGATTLVWLLARAAAGLRPAGQAWLTVAALLLAAAFGLGLRRAVADPVNHPGR